jgi:hypothetical protein
MAGRHCLEQRPADLTGQRRIESRLIPRRAHRARLAVARRPRRFQKTFACHRRKAGGPASADVSIYRECRGIRVLTFAGMTPKVSGAPGFMPRRTLIQYFR